MARAATRGECAMRCRPYRIVLLWLCAVVALLPRTSARADDSDSARVERFFIHASSGSVRHRDLVQPGKDSIIAMGEKGAYWLARKLNATDARQRLTLAEIFEKIGAAAVPHLAPYLDSSGEYMPKNAARCLGVIKDTSATLALIPHLEHGLYAVRSEVATALGKIADPRAAISLARQLRIDDDTDVRKSCAVALGAIGDTLATGVLIAALGDSFFGVRQSAVEALGRLKPPPCAEILRAANAASGVTEHGAIVALGACSDSTSFRQLLTLLDDPDPLRRGFAVEALAQDTSLTTRALIEEHLAGESDIFVRAQLRRAVVGWNKQ